MANMAVLSQLSGSLAASLYYARHIKYAAMAYLPHQLFERDTLGNKM